MKKTIKILILMMLAFVLIGCNNNASVTVKDPCIKEEVEKDKPEEKENPDKPVEEEKPVKLGIDSIDENLDLFKNKKVGLLTNPTGFNSSLTSTIDVLNEKINLVALFSPEHGIRGAAQAGASVGNSKDVVTGLPIYSLYGGMHKPTASMMNEVDIIAVDIQDVGSRFYTYVYTMSYVMEACKEYDKELVVFDRPNPINGVSVEGNLIKPGYTSFIGRYPIVQRHGMTIGEIAKLFNEEFGINCKLHVVKMKNWEREMYYRDTNLPWVNPSPNMPTQDTALVYPGTCIFEGTNLSEGRGTTKPFEFIGAPWINSIDLANKLNKLPLKGVYFRPISFKPTFSKYKGVMCFGVQVHVTNKELFQPVITGWLMQKEIRRLYPDKFQTKSSMNLLSGSDILASNTYSVSQLKTLIDKDTNTFIKTREKYLLYK